MKLPFQLDRYTLVHRIGVGAFGQVYRAEVRGDMGFVSDFAVKVLEATVVADNPNVAHQLADEARILSQLDHPNIVKVVDFKHVEHSVLGDVYFMVMECVRGTDVATLLRRRTSNQGTIPATAVLHMGLMVSDALAHAHALESRDGSTVCIVHRDLKPQNLMVNFRGQVKVLDFGIAKATDDDRLAQRTQEGQTKGTVFYMSTEQLAGEPLDGRSDIYSLGTILYEMLLGSRLLDVEVNTAAELVRAMHTAFEMDIEARLSLLRTHLQGGHNGALSQEAISGWLGLLRAALQKDRTYRPDSAAAFSQQLERLRSLHPPAENRDFWAHEVEAAEVDQQVTFDTARKAQGRPAEPVPEDASGAGSGTHEFFGISTGATADDEAAASYTSPETVPLTRGMGVVTGTVRSFGSEVIQRLGPISRSQPILMQNPIQEESTEPFRSEAGAGPQALEELPARGAAADQMRREDVDAETGPGMQPFSGDDTDNYEITITDTNVVRSGSYRQRKGRKKATPSRRKPVLIGASTGLLSALLILGLVGLITWLSGRSDDTTGDVDSEPASLAVGADSAAREISPDGVSSPAETANAEAAASPAEQQQASELLASGSAGRAKQLPHAGLAPAKDSAEDKPERNSKLAAAAKPDQQSTHSRSKMSATKRERQTTADGSQRTPAAANSSRNKPRSSQPGSPVVASPLSNSKVTAPASSNTDSSEFDLSQLGFVRLVARPRCRVIRYECPCPWAKARTAPPDAGIDLGTTDETRKGVWLPAGTHRIRFICDDEEECKGFKSRTGGKTVTVEAGQKKIYKVDFYAINEGAQ